MKSIEDDFQALVDALEAGRIGALSPTEHRITMRFGLCGGGETTLSVLQQKISR
jgi:hypothetical protein